MKSKNSPLPYLAHFMQALFWIALSLVAYTYVAYGLLLLLLNSLSRRKTVPPLQVLSEITFIVPAYNEAEVIEAKIKNTLSLHYPPTKITYLFITDGSNDGTAEAVAAHPVVNLLHQSERRGKSAAINRAMEQVITPIVVFSDANSLLQPDSLLKLAAHFADSTIGGVSGEKRIAASAASSAGTGERLYWQYESLLKRANAGFYTIVGAAGELFAIRTHVFQALKEDIILDDFFISAAVCLQGYRFGYEKDAVAVEASSASIHEEGKRKVRISAGCYQALMRLPGLLNPFRHGRLVFQYVSHRVLRWVACPLLLPVIFLSNAWLYANKAGAIYTFLFWVQCGCYGLAAAGYCFPALRRRSPLLLVTYYFVFMVAAQYRGFLRFALGGQPAVWEKVRREALAAPPGFTQTVNEDSHPSPLK